jgi:AraC-like DNA-binding protein
MGNFVTGAQKRKLFFRPNKTPGVNLPFGVRSVGYYQVSAGFEEPPMAKHFVQLFWGIEGEGEIYLKGIPRIMKPRHVILYYPGDEHHTRATSRSWRYRWLTLDGPLCAETVKSFGLGQEPREAGACPDELFIRLEEQVQNLSSSGERKACVTAFEILEAAGRTGSVVKPEDLKIEQCLKMINTEYGNSQFGVERMAQALRIHRSLLSRLFKLKTGTSPGDYLISLRLQKALSLLKETDLSVAEISARTGYRDPNYFAKAVRKTLGVSPREFRRI